MNGKVFEKNVYVYYVKALMLFDTLFINAVWLNCIPRTVQIRTPTPL